MKIILIKTLQVFFKLLTFLMIGLTLVLAYMSFFEKELLKSGIEWMKVAIESLGNWNYLIAGVSSMIESFPVLGVVIPGQNILLAVGGFFGNISQTHLAYIIIISSIGATLGNFIGYILGRYYGDSFFAKYGIWFGIGLTEVRYLKKGIDKWGAIGIILGKFHPITRAFLPFIAGSMGMKSGLFAIYNIVGSIIRSVVIILLGVVFVEYYEFLIDHSGKITAVIFAAIGIYIYKFKRKEFKKYMQEKNEEMEALAEKR